MINELYEDALMAMKKGSVPLNWIDILLATRKGFHDAKEAALLSPRCARACGAKR